MTIDDQLRDIARHAEQHQQVITAVEIVQGASSQGTGSFTTRSRFNGRRKVLNHMPVQFTEDEATMVDLETPSPTDDRQKGPKRLRIAGLLAAAAVVAIAFGASRDGDDATPGDQPSPTVTVPATTPPLPLLSPWPPLDPRDLGETQNHNATMQPGTYFLDEVDGTPTPRIFVTIGTGWSYLDSTLSKFERNPSTYSGWIAFSRPDRVFLDACHWEDGFYPGPLATFDGLVAALSEQGGWAEVTAPSDISIDGYAGKAFQRTVPDISDCDIQSDRGPRNPTWGQHTFRSWDLFSEYEPGMIETVWVLDIDGTAIVINATPSAGADVEFAAVLDSIRIERG